MKKVFTLILITFAAFEMALAGEIITMDIKQLPKKSQQFIANYFPNEQVKLIKIDKEFFSKEYEVKLSNNIELEFNDKGEWQKVDCGRNAVPQTIIPSFAKQYVEANFPGIIITETKRDGSKIKVELSNDVSIKFNRHGKVLEFDD